MKASDIPVKMPTVWASSAGVDVHQVPTPSQIAITPGAASFTDGFPPLNFLPSASGGVPPFGIDWNGVLQQITAWNQWQQLGGPVPYDSTFASGIAGLGTTGYPRGASIAGQLGTGNVVPGCYWFSLSDGNTGNPDSGGTGWSQMFALNGTATINVAGNTDVTLTPAQYGYQTILCTGTLTGNINVIFPINGRWLLENKTTGTFTLKAKTVSGSGALIGQGTRSAIQADGTSIVVPNYIDDALTITGITTARSFNSTIGKASALSSGQTVTAYTLPDMGVPGANDVAGYIVFAGGVGISGTVGFVIATGGQAIVVSQTASASGAPTISISGSSLRLTMGSSGGNLTWTIAQLTYSSQ